MMSEGQSDTWAKKTEGQKVKFGGQITSDLKSHS